MLPRESKYMQGACCSHVQVIVGLSPTGNSSRRELEILSQGNLFVNFATAAFPATLQASPEIALNKFEISRISVQRNGRDLQAIDCFNLIFECPIAPSE